MNTGFWDDRDWSREDWQDWQPKQWTRSIAALPPIPEPPPAPKKNRAKKRRPAPKPEPSPMGRWLVIGGLGLVVAALAAVFVLVALERFG